MLETPRDVNQLNYKILSNVLFYTPIDYVVGLHNIHVIYVLNYTRNDYIIYMLYKFRIIQKKNVSDFLSVPNTKKTFLAHFQSQNQTQKNKWYSFLENVFQKMTNYLENVYEETNGA